jgi:hypothetical protein
MLNASRVPDDATVVSKWSHPPQIGRNKNPPTTMMVNYTPTDFPTLQKKSRKVGIAIEWAGVQEAHFIWLSCRNTGKRWATSLIVKLWEVAWDLWDHRNQIKFNLEMAQDLARKESILLAVCSEYAFGRSTTS